MTSFRSKFISWLVVYFAGFATAIYALVPAPDVKPSSQTQKHFASSFIKSDEFARSFRAGMDKCILFTKNAAWRAAELLKQKLDEGKLLADR